jgi:hypothetical protein
VFFFSPFMIFMWVLPIARSSLVELICRREGRVEEEASSCKQASRQAGKQAGRGLTLKLLEILLWKFWWSSRRSVCVSSL